MTQPVLETLKNLLASIFPSLALRIKQCPVRDFLAVSFLMQSFLLLAGPFRKNTSNRFVLVVVWLAYIYSDWASNYAVGLIPAFKNGGASTGCGPDLVLLWSPFLVLHVGGTDSISALTSSDNELWSRFAIQLATMTYGIASASYRSFVESNLRVLVVLMFVAGFSKYLERLLSFFQARFSALKESILEEKTKSCRKALHLSDRGSCVLSDAKMVRDGYCLFQSSKALFVDLPMDSDDRKKTKAYFLNRNSGDALRIVEIELNFSYDLFYSKGPVLRQWLGLFLRPLGMVCEVIALVLWLRIDKRNFQKSDLPVTNALLKGAVARNFISLLMITFSDWTIASVVVRGSGDSKLANRWLSLRKRRWGHSGSNRAPNLCVSLSRLLLRRWSESISQLNFMDLCLDNSEQKEGLLEALGIHFLTNKLRGVPKKWFTNDLGDFIFQELKNKASQANACLTRGQWTLKNYRQPQSEEFSNLSRTWIAHKTYDESLLVWHIATTLCYHTEEQGSLEESEKKRCELSRVLSDYMLYLLLRSPEVMLEVAAMGDWIHEGTQAEAKSFFRWLFEQSSGADGDALPRVQVACRGLLREVRENGGNLGNSLLFEAGRLAIKLKEVKGIQGVKMWEVIAKVWVEMLSYGAARCSPSAHAAELANGGELITLVWLLMEHLDLSKLV